jgi:hypothetical protein
MDLSLTTYDLRDTEEDTLVTELAPVLWKSLVVSEERRSSPPSSSTAVATSLLYKAHFTSTSYSLLLSDGINVWGRRTTEKGLAQERKVILTLSHIVFPSLLLPQISL